MFYLATKNNRKKLIKLIEQKYFLIVAIVSFSILTSAYVLEHFFNHPPCNLCEYQRVPYFLLLLISLLSMQIKKNWLKFFLLFVLLQALQFLDFIL